MKKNILLIIVFLIISGKNVFPQSFNLRTNLLAGYTRNFHFSTFADKLYAFNPEIQLEGQLIKSNLNWLVYISYWDDNVNGPSNRITDTEIFYSFNDLSIGSRVYYLPVDLTKNFSFIECSVFLGFSHSFISGTNTIQTSNNISQKVNLEVNIAELGGRILFKLGNSIGIFSEYELKFHLATRDLLHETRRNSIKLGITYFF